MSGEDITMQVKMNQNCFAGIEQLARGQRIDEGQILDIVDFINHRYDCADFRLVCVLRTLYSFSHLLSESTLHAMEDCVLNFKYWMDEPGQDSMCYWSENHQLLFAVCEYLAGQKYPDRVFPNSGLTGKQHRQKAAERIERWMQRRFSFGFVEFHSNTYYEEDAAPLSLLIDFCEDTGMVLHAKMLMDLLMLDLALHSFQGRFCAASGRCYEKQKKDLAQVAEAFRGHRDLDDEGAFLWAMEAFTNPESIQQTMAMYTRFDLSGNIFLKDLQVLANPLLRKLHLLPLLVRILNPVTQGVAIQRANTYTYKTAHYMLSTAQSHHPQEFGDQQHIWQATLPGDVAVFTTHPAASGFEDNARNFSPGRWVGNGIMPHSIQQGNLTISLYDLRARKGLMEKSRQMHTHAWAPFDRLDKILWNPDKTLLCVRKGESYLALHSVHPMEAGGEENELIQNGQITGWACVAGSGEDYGSWETFTSWMQACALELRGDTLTFHAGDAVLPEPPAASGRPLLGAGTPFPSSSGKAPAGTARCWIPTIPGFPAPMPRWNGSRRHIPSPDRANV